MTYRQNKSFPNFSKFKLKQEDKYYDLLITFTSSKRSVKIHKALICESSGLISRLLIDDNDWPPINTIEIQLPKNITEEAFTMAIDYLYTDKSETNIDLINALIYLEVDPERIISLIKKSLSPETELEPAQIDLLHYIYKLYPENSSLKHLLNFYGASEGDLSFGQENEAVLVEVYQKKKESAFSRLSDYVPAKEKKWFHFRSFPPDCRQNFVAFGVKWKLSRFLCSFGYGDDEDLIKIYTNEGFDGPDDPLNIRASFIIFSEDRNPEIEIIQKDKVIPSHYKLIYMRINGKSNSLGFSMPRFNEKKVRISFLFELL